MEAASTIGRVMQCLLAGFSFKVGLPGAIEASFNANEALSQAHGFGRRNCDANVPRSFYHGSFPPLRRASVHDWGGSKRR